MELLWQNGSEAVSSQGVNEDVCTCVRCDKGKKSLLHCATLCVSGRKPKKNEHVHEQWTEYNNHTL